MQKINDADVLELDDIEEEEVSALAELIRSRYDDAESARNDNFFAGQSINDWLNESYERYTANHCNEHFNLVRIKTDVVHAKVKDMTVGSIDAPFVIKPTPIPELSKEQTESIQLDLETKLAEKLIEENIVIVEMDGTVTPRFDAVMNGHKLKPDVANWLKEQAKLQKKSQQYEAGRIAGEAITNATRLMLDQMAEGKWKKANLEADFDDFLYGTGCIKEETKQVKNLKWSGDKFKEVTKEQVVWRHVPIHSCYPSPDSEDAQTGIYFIEKASMRKQELRACKEIEWFNEDNLDEAFEYVKENVAWLDEKNPEVNEGWDDDRLVSVLIHQGSVSGDSLNEYFDYDDDDDGYLEPYDFYDIEAYLLADVVIGCRIMNHPFGNRTYYSSCYKSAGKSFWGIGLAMLLARREDKLNSYEQDIRINLDKTVYPPIFYNIAMFESPKHVDDGLSGKGKTIPYNSDPSLPTGIPQKPYTEIQFDSKTAELTNMFSRDYRLADDESGIPSMLSGNSDLKGGESTFRGMKLLAAASNIIIKSYFHNKDETRVQPAMKNLWYYNMLNSKDETIKADANVIARGTAGLMQQEIANAERLEAMPIISSLLGASSMSDEAKASVVNYLLRETMIAGGLPAGQLMTDPAVTQEQNESIKGLTAGQPVAQQLPPEAQPANVQPGTPLPTIGSDQNQGGLV